MDKKTNKTTKVPLETKLKKIKDWESILKALSVPHITEKATAQAESSKYIFKVPTRANKITIKQAVKELYGKETSKIAIVNIKKKPKRKGRKIGYRPGYKKAIVSLKGNETLDLFAKK